MIVSSKQSGLKVKGVVITSLLTLVVLSLLAGAFGCTANKRLRVATTTSLYDTGIWDYLEPIFEDGYGIELDVLYAGTGIALEYGRRGDVDIIAVHSKSRE